MTELTKDDRVKREVLRIKKLLRDLPEDRLKMADGVIKRAAFMAIQLEDLEEDIKEHGNVESFRQNRECEYDRERPATRIYNTVVKNYQSAIKYLVDLIPPQEGVKKKDQLLEFLKR